MFFSMEHQSISLQSTIVYISLPQLLSLSPSIGCGFGVSGAAALGTGFTVNNLFNLGKTRDQLAQIAHIAEIKEGTGLGTVETEITGGFLLKTAPGLPVRAIKLPFIGKKVYATILGPLLTREVLKDTKSYRRINDAADKALSQCKKSNITLEEVFDISCQFVKENGLLTDPEMITIVESIKKDGGHATMAILGRVILSDIPPMGLPYPIEKLIVTKNHPSLM